MNVLVDGEIVLYGTVGEDFFFDGFTALDVVRALAEIGRGDDVTVRINSGGGYVDEGTAVYNALAAHRGNVTTIVDGIAASAASLIFMAGDKRIMRRGSTMMIHDPALMTVGNSADHQKSVEALEALANSMADAYAEASGQTREQARADMQAETWLTPDDALARGYADETQDAAAEEATAFDYGLYRNTPEPLRAVASAHGWLGRGGKRPAAKRKEQATMADTTTSATATPPATSATATPSAPPATAAAGQQQPAATTAAAPNAVTRVDILAAETAAEIATMCATAGVPAMAATLLREPGITAAAARERVDGAKEIKAAVALARKSCAAIDPALADQYIAAGTSLANARADLFSRITAAQAAAPTSSAHQAGTGADADIAAMWKRATDKVNARVKAQQARQAR